MKPGGYKPLPRSSIGCTTAPNGKAYCFGGVMDIDEDEEDVHGQFGDDLLALDLSTHTWRLLEIAKTSKQNETNSKDVNMTDTAASTSTVSSDGVFTITVAGSSEAKPALPKVPSLFPNLQPKSVPSPRMNPGLCVCKGTLYVYGGLYEEDSKQYTFNDFFAVDLHKLSEWKVLIQKDLNAHDWIDSDSNSDSDDSEETDDDESESEMDTE